MSLTISELKEKIAKVELDLEELRRTGDSSRKTEVLTEYKNYLKDELKILENEKRNSKT